MGNIYMACPRFKSILDIFIEKSHSKLPSHPLKNREWRVGRRVVSTTLPKLTHDWIIYIGNSVH